MSDQNSTAVPLKDNVPLPLKAPVQLTDKEGNIVETITELTFRRLKGAAARKALNLQSKGNGEFIAALICASAQIPPSTFDQLDMIDVMAAMEIATDFFGVSLPT